ncbi:unnamed protein product [Allacma fusca]|uniref:BMP-binding endothelial regulator protein n=1 Tax=Allacma fusca TaxID=39272 RepID=A0A8J2KBW5_9HEXA|nr:unnamed protein product [Allacma fusca]
MEFSQSNPAPSRVSKILTIISFRWHFVIIALSLTVRFSEAAGNTGGGGLIGVSQKCDREGEVFPLPEILRNKCFTCLCKGGFVECEKQSCPSLQGCSIIPSDEKDGCCEVCKGCKVGNVTYKSGVEITQDCMTSTCSAGVLTRSPVQCYFPCKNPAPPKPGQCCPSCNTCSLNGREYKNGEEATLSGDPCVRCKCEMGSMVCTKNSCPVLACPASSTYLERGECCPRCNRSRIMYLPRTACFLGERSYPNSNTFRLDTCTNCTCVENTAVCERISCPPLECQPIHQAMTPGSCCPKCVEPALPKAQCIFNDIIYKNEERWDVDKCRSCKCDWGNVRCTEQMCPKNKHCPWGYKLKILPGQCCPECVGEEGVCTVFGDPHYRSFDGRVFNFQGACKYLLTSDCRSKSFSVRVRNDARESRAFSWTRTVTLKVREGRVTLGQKMRIKYNGKRVALPFSQGSLRIYQDGYSAMVETGVGVKLLWDGDSFLEVSVPHSMQGRLCGLCGNFNGNKSDDLTTRRGSPANHPNAFGKSWRVGGIKACSRPEEVKGPEPLCQKNGMTRSKAEKACNTIKFPVFSRCHKTIPLDRFFKSCTLDMCECPQGRKCHCEVLTAYARACQRSGIDIQNWREDTGCSHKRKWQR